MMDAVRAYILVLVLMVASAMAFGAWLAIVLAVLDLLR